MTFSSSSTRRGKTDAASPHSPPPKNNNNNSLSLMKNSGVCCAPAPAPSPPPFVPDTPTPTTPPATAPPAPTPVPAPGPPPPPAFECPFGLLPTVVPPLSITDCIVKSCDPCGSAAPDLYQTGALSIYVSPAWTPATPVDSATLVCSLDYSDPNICSQNSQSQNAACTTNDIAVDAQVRR